MSESDKTESAPPQQKPTDQSEAVAEDEFLKALNMGGDKGLKEAFNVLTKEKPTACVSETDLQCAVAIRGGPKLPLEKVKATIQEINKEGVFNYDEFVDIIKLLKDPGEANQTNKIHEKLKEAGEGKKIILCGKEGVGKTWLARKVGGVAVRKGDFDVAIWVYLNRIYDGLSLHESIAYQLYKLAALEESEADEAKKKKEKEKADEVKKKELGEVTEEIKKKREKMEKVINKAIEGKRLLFILDSQGSRMEADWSESNIVAHDQKEGEKKVEEKKEKEELKKVEEKIEKEEEKKKKEELKNVVLKLKVGGGGMVTIELKRLKSYKIMITTSREKHEVKDDEITVKPFTWDDSKALASRTMVAEGVHEKNEEVEELARYFMFRSERLPSHLLLISRIVSYFAKEEFGLQKLRHYREMVKKGGVNVLDVLIKEFRKLPKSVLIDCYSPETPEGHFLRRGSKVSFNALICYWIMEGHLGYFDRIEEAYVEGHRVLMELMNCGLLQKQESDYVVPSGATQFHFDIHDYKEFFSGTRPGLAVTFDMRLGRVALGDGMIKTVGKKSLDGKEEIISTLLLDGNRISEEDSPLEILRKYKEKVQVLAITEPTSQHFELPILEMRELRLLALRGCQFLNSLDHLLVKKKSDQQAPKPDLSPNPSPAPVGAEKVVPKPDLNPGPSLGPVGAENLAPKPDLNPGPSLGPVVTVKLENLAVLEISGPSSVEKIPDELFGLMPNLKTLNMSNLHKVESLPDSFYLLTQIEFLILRGCKNLKELKSLKTFKDLKVLDVSNATSFEKFEDKSLHSNTKLQILNLSNTKLKTLPLINQLQELKFVWLRDCAVLPRIRKLDKMKSLQIFDIAGAAEVERFCDPSLEDLHNLLIVDISRTAIKRLPANIGDPTYLYAKNCPKLKVVPPVEGLSKLEVLHLSGCVRLREVRKEFFTKVEVLRELDLSKTRVKELPFLSSLVSLLQLLLSECELLEKLDGLGSLKDLEFLDLSGCKALMELEDKAFDNMIHLQRLNLSGTGIGGQQKPLPSLSNLESLKELHVRDCPNLTELPDVEKVPKLEVLDFSGTVLESPPKVSNAVQVIGAGIESINTIQLFENLGATQQGEGAKWDFKPQEVSLCKWNISNWPIEAAEDEKKLGTPVYGVHFLRLLKECPLFLEENLKAFRFLVYPSETKLHKDFRDSYIDELGLRDIYFDQVHKGTMERFLEIRGFKELPKSLRPLIARAEVVVLVDDPFLRSLLDLGVASTMPMKACWIESCNEMEHVVAVPEKAKEAEKPGEAGKSGGEQRKNVKLGGLVKGEGDRDKKVGAGKVGEATKSEGDQQKNIAATAEKSGEAAKGEGDQQKSGAAEKSGEAAKSGGDEEKNAAADSSGDQQKNAAEEKSGESGKSEDDHQKSPADEKSGESAKSEGDQQKNAAAAAAADDDDKSVEPAKSEGAAAEESKEAAKSESDEQKNVVGAKKKSEEAAAKSEGEQQKKATPSEKSGEAAAKGEGDQQQNASSAEKSKEAAKSEGEQQNKSEGSELKNPAEDLNSLETLWISDVSNLKTILKGDIQTISFTLLKSLYLEFCPNLSAITSSSMQLQNLETLYIKYCHNLKSLFTDDNSPKLGKLLKLQIWGLDSLQRISCKALKLQKLRVGQCPLLQHVIASRLTEAGAEVEAEAKDTITGQPYETEGHEYLELLHIKSCDNLTTIFDSSETNVQFEKLTHLQLSGLPKLQKVARAVPALRDLRVDDCPSLESVISGENGATSLEILEVRCCEKMKRIIGGGDSKLEEVKKIELIGLPELENLGAGLLGKGIGEGEIWACPKLKDTELIEWFKSA